ncbi:glycosyltransferase family 4 protein [Phocaeicola sp.]
MDLVFITEERFIRLVDGKVYSIGGKFNNKLWSRYLQAFEKIIVLARVKVCDRNNVIEDNLASSDNVSFVDLPYYIGPLQYLCKYFKLKENISQNIIYGRAYICRVPGQISFIAYPYFKKKGVPYALEVVGDPWDVFSPKGIQHPLRTLFRILGRLTMQQMVRNAAASLFVTKRILQLRYPPMANTYTTIASNIFLPDDSLSKTSKEFSVSNNVVKIISVGSLEQMYKSPDIVIDALAILKEKEISCYWTWLGGGKYYDEMKEYALRKGVEHMINFVGNVTGENIVRNYLAQSDLFVLVSRTEGLPRAIIEAMAEGLPCIGSKVGGIPELLDEMALVNVGDAQQLASKILFFICNPNLMNSQAKRNLLEAKEYVESILRERRINFYNEVMRISKL